MRTHRITTTIAVVGLLACVIGGCSKDSNPTSTSTYSHTLAPAGRNDVWIDGVRFPFADDLDYAEYYEGADLAEEYSYYSNKGFHSFFNIDLNADSEFIQFMILDVNIKPGIYQVGDSELAGIVRVNYEFHDTITNQDAQKIKSGSLEITSVDVQARRISGIFRLAVVNTKSNTPHTIEGSFTDIFYQYGADGGECGTADIVGNGFTSLFNSKEYVPAFGNNHGQGSAEDLFSIQIATEESQTLGYESLRLSVTKPLQLGTQDIAVGNAIFTKYSFDQTTKQYVAIAADTNTTVMPGAITITDFDTVRRRVSGTFAFTLTDNSSRSPIVVTNGKFSDLFWW